MYSRSNLASLRRSPSRHPVPDRQTPPAVVYSAEQMEQINQLPTPAVTFRRMTIDRATVPD